MNDAPPDRPAPDPSDLPVSEVDVAVVGGGVSGCYTAWRLAQTRRSDLPPSSPLRALMGDGDRLRVGLYEYLDRIGGRLWSVMLDKKDMPGQYTEFGGMRLFPQMHIVWQLIEHLGVGGDKIPLPADEPENFTYVRRKHLRNAQINSPAIEEHPDAVPYNLRYVERGKDSTALGNYLFDFAVPGFSQLLDAYQAAFAAGQWARVDELRLRYEQAKKDAKIDGIPLRDWGYWALASRVLSTEAMEFLQDTGGYNTYTSTGSVATQMDETFYFPASPQYVRLQDGYEALPQGLFDQLIGADGVGRLLWQLLRFDKEADGYSLMFYQRTDVHDRAPDVQQLTFDQRRRCHVVKAKMIVLAMPQRSLELLDQDTFFFGKNNPDPRYARLRDAMSAVVPVQAFKIFVAYDFPWWESTGVTKGRSTTDLPIRQMYYWFTEAGAPGRRPPPVNMDSLVLATYESAEAATFWRSTEGGPLYAVPTLPDGTPRRRFFTYPNRAAARLHAANLQAPAPRRSRPPRRGSWSAPPSARSSSSTTSPTRPSRSTRTTRTGPSTPSAAAGTAGARAPTRPAASPTCSSPSPTSASTSWASAGPTCKAGCRARSTRRRRCCRTCSACPGRRGSRRAAPGSARGAGPTRAEGPRHLRRARSGSAS